MLEQELISLPHDPTPVEVPAAESMSDAELQTAIENALSGKTENPEPPKQEQVQPAVNEPPKQEQVQEPQVVEAPKVEEPKEPKVAEPPQGGQVEQPTEQTETPFDEVQRKMGFKSKEDLAKSYMELNKAYHRKRREEIQSEKTAQPVQEQPQITQPYQVSNYEEFNQKIMDDLQRDPVNTVRALVKITTDAELAEDREARRIQNLHSTIDRLSSSPDTASYNDPEIQAEMQKIYKERPDLVPDMVQNMEDVYDQAEGRIARRRRQVVNQTAPKSKPAVVEGAAKPAPIQRGAVDPNSMTDDELLNAINAAWNAGHRLR